MLRLDFGRPCLHPWMSQIPATWLAHWIFDDMSLWPGVPNKLAGDSNQQWNHYMSFKPPHAHSCILQQDGNILYLCVIVCLQSFLRYKLTYLKYLKVSDLHPCLKRCSVTCDEARPCSVSLYSLMGWWGWRVCNKWNEVIFIPRSLFASFVPYLKNESQILAGAFNVVKVHSWTGTHSSSCDGAEVSSSSVFFFLLAYLYSWVYIITIYKRTQTQRVLCGYAPFVFLVAFTPARSSRWGTESALPRL